MRSCIEVAVASLFAANGRPDHSPHTGRTVSTNRPYLSSKNQRGRALRHSARELEEVAVMQRALADPQPGREARSSKGRSRRGLRTAVLTGSVLMLLGGTAVADLVGLPLNGAQVNSDSPPGSIRRSAPRNRTSPAVRSRAARGCPGRCSASRRAERTRSSAGRLPTACGRRAATARSVGARARARRSAAR